MVKQELTKVGNRRSWRGGKSLAISLVVILKKRFERAPNNLYYHYRRNDECMRAGKEKLPLELKR